jgi:hypothetical protein
MTTRRSLLLTLPPAFVCTAASLAAADVQAGLDGVIANHTSARGGANALDAIHEMRSTIDINEQGAVLHAVYCANVGGHMRIDVSTSDGTRVWSEGLDQDGPWEWPQSAKAATVAAKGGAALTHGLEFNLFGLHRFTERGATLSLSPRERIADVLYHVVEVTLADGFQTWLYIDPNTWMIVRRRDFRPIHPAIDATSKWFENEYWDYRRISGVQTAFRDAQLDLATAKIVQMSVTTSLAYNPRLDASTYSRTAIPA